MREVQHHSGCGHKHGASSPERRRVICAPPWRIPDVHLHQYLLDGVVAQGRPELLFRGPQVDEACVQRVRMQSRSRNWSLSRPWSWKSALRKWHVRRSGGGCGSAAGRER